MFVVILELRLGSRIAEATRGIAVGRFAQGDGKEDESK
jgi:hypothetical protein